MPTGKYCVIVWFALRMAEMDSDTERSIAKTSRGTNDLDDEITL